MSAGFFVVLVVTAVLVVLPTLLLFRAAWRSGGVARATALVGIATLSGIAIALLPPSATVNSLEEGAVVFFAAWGIILALIGTSAFLAVAVKSLWSSIRWTSKP